MLNVDTQAIRGKNDHHFADDILKLIFMTIIEFDSNVTEMSI